MIVHHISCWALFFSYDCDLRTWPRDNQHAKYLGQRSFHTKIIVRTHRHTQRTDCSTRATKVIGNIQTDRTAAAQTRIQLTSPSFKHIVDEKIDEARLRFGNVACSAVKYRHDNRQSVRFLIVRLITSINTSRSNHRCKKRFLRFLFLSRFYVF